MNRRGFLQSILAAGVAPYVVISASVLMPVRRLWTPPDIRFIRLVTRPVAMGGGAAWAGVWTRPEFGQKTVRQVSHDGKQWFDSLGLTDDQAKTLASALEQSMGAPVHVFGDWLA